MTFYCKSTQTYYKQGLNELMAPFLILGRQGLTRSKIYLYFRNFIRDYMPALFIDTEFRALQALMLLYNGLLRYFDPELSVLLEDLSIGPELYASPWFLTMFARRMSRCVIPRLWIRCTVSSRKRTITMPDHCMSTCYARALWLQMFLLIFQN